jgi:hypothetical protein
MGEEIGSCGEERLSEAHVGLRVVLVGVRLRNFEWRTRECLPRRRREIGERTGTDRREERRAIRGPSSRFTVVTGKPKISLCSRRSSALFAPPPVSSRWFGDRPTTAEW